MRREVVTDDGPDGHEQTGGRVRNKRSRRFKLVAGLIVGLVIAWLAAASVMALLGIRDASRATRELQEAKSELNASGIVGTQPQQALEAARAEFADSSNLLDSAILDPATFIPILGRQMTTVRDMSHAATEVSAIGVSALSQLRGVLDSPHKSGPARVAALERLTTLARRTYDQLKGVSPGPSGRLISPLASKYDQFTSELQEVRTRLQHASAVAGALTQILKGPSRYLLLVSNNAEMRAGSGMFLEAGSLSVEDGQVELGTLVDTGTIELPAGAVRPTGDLAARWGWLEPTQDWRNLGLTPNFDQIGPVAAEMWFSAEHQRVQGVMSIDIEALEELLQVTGPVTLPGGYVASSSDVVQLLMHDEYEGLNFSESNAQVQRVSRLGALAKATLDAVQSRPLDLKALANAMSNATAGRHIELWSAQPSEESAWDSGGVSGELSNNSLMAAVLNRSGAKLDQYVSVSCNLSVRAVGGRSDASLVVTLENNTPPGQSAYIAGPYPGLGTVYGEYVGFLAVNIPASASSKFRFSGASGPQVAWGAEGPVWVLAVPVDVKAGKSQAVVVDFDMPGTSGTLTVVPSARIPPESWTFRGKSFTDAAPRRLSW